ncbi:MAG: PHP domain-containing protein [Candidatus Hydrothermarchaeota archaeon]
MIFDLHVHSIYSHDCNTSIPQIINKAEEIKLDGISITDHDTLRGYEEAKKVSKNVIVIPGIEISLKEGHLLVLGIEEEPPRVEIMDVLEWVRDNNGVSIAAHPFDSYKGLGDLVSTLPLDGIEVYNAKYKFSHVNIRADKISRKLNLSRIGGSDAHNLEEIGSGFTIIDGPLIKAIKKKRTEVGLR